MRSSADALDIRVEPRDRCTVVRLTGSANMVMCDRLRDQLVKLVSEESPHLVLDIAGLEFISSLGLGGIIAAHLRCRRLGGRLLLVAPQPAILDVLNVTKLNLLLPVHPTVDDAIASI